SGQQVQLEIKARMDGQPAAGATVMVDGKELGVTDGTGVLARPLTRSAGAEVDVLVSKELPGHRIKPWKTTLLIKLGKDGKIVDRYSLEADLAVTRYFTVAVNEQWTPGTAASDEYGVRAGVPGVAVSVDGRPLGKTDERGVYTYTYEGAPGRKAQVALSAPGYLPTDWKTAVALEGQVSVQRAFAPATPRP